MSVLHRLWTRWTEGAMVPAVVRRPLHLFGKLPLSKEFICVGGADPAARELRRWLSRGFSQRWATENPGLEVAPHQFLLRLPASGRSVVGCLWGSGDEAGLRRFPFVVFATLRPGSPGAHPLTAFGYLDAFDRLGAEIRGGQAAHANVAAFRRTYGRREVELTLRPPPAGLSAFIQATLRLAWTEGAGSAPVGFLIPVGGGPAASTLFFRDLRPDDILLLHPKAM